MTTYKTATEIMRNDMPALHGVVTVAMPQRITAELLHVVRHDPLCAHPDKDEMDKRIGWLVCAYDAMVAESLRQVRLAGRDHSGTALDR